MCTIPSINFTRFRSGMPSQRRRNSSRSNGRLLAGAEAELALPQLGP